MRRMSSEEDQDVFEITDFTTASDWERFIARIEEVFHEWKLPQHTLAQPLKKGELTDGTWLEKREQLMFASFQFEAVHHQLKQTSTDYDSPSNLENDDEGEPLPFCLMDMMSRENDFPPKAHCLVRWYGLREFVVIHPAKSNDAIMTEDRTKMLLSSVYIAVNNTNCQVPVFVQLQQMRQKYFLGVCEGGGVRTSFDMVHLHRAFSQYSHLSGLLSLFKSKLASSTLDVPPVSLSIRFTYVLQDWSPCSWPQPPPEIDELGEDITPTDIGRLPCGALEDPVLEFHLSVTWPYLFEDAIVDNDIHSDLNPVLSPKWSMRMKTSEKPSCSMADYLKEFAMLAQGYDAENQLLGNIVPDEDETSNQNITQALDKLAQPNTVPLPRLSLILPHPRNRRQSDYQQTMISEEVLIKILQFIFPDSAPTPVEPETDEWKDTFNTLSELQNSASYAKIQEHMRSFKSAPVDSLTWRLALAMCQVNHSYGGLAAVAQLWQDFLLEMRHRWENNYTLPCLDPGAPNMTYCLLHQKLQMLNCCIQRKKLREWHQVQQSSDSIPDVSKPLAPGDSPEQCSESDDEEFFECTENSSASSVDSKGSKRKFAEGRLRQLGELKLINCDEPLYIPVTQEPAPVTAGKKALNKLHSELGSSGFTQVYVDQRDENTVAITRHCPATHQSVLMIARTSFSMPSKPNESSYTKPLRIPGVVDEIILEGCLVPVNHSGTTLGPNVDRDEDFINGLTDFKLNLKQNIQIYESDMIESSGISDDGYNEIDFIHFPPGSVIVLRISLDSESRSSILKLRTCVSQFGYRMRSYSGTVLKRGTQDFESILSHLTLSDLNRILYKCDAEERDDMKGRGTYSIPGYGNLVYCGLQGIMSELMNIHVNDDLGHPLCQNLRDGDWLADYISSRLIDNPSTKDLGLWFQVVFESLKKIPRYLIPCYFDTIITGAYSSLLNAVWRKMSDFISEGSTFVKALAMGSVILCGIVRSAPLPLLSPNLEPPVPTEVKGSSGNVLQNCITMSAGLPHFSTGYMRNWGRDTFISLKGLLLVAGRYEDARYIILAFAACLRHGLIPNLLDRGECARFNCRDAVWWWVQSIQEYVKIVPEGHKILKDKVSRIFPTDDSLPQPPGKHDQPLHDVIQEALQTHFQGLKFRERNAGYQLDEHMSDEGFNNEIGVDLETGFVFGGNRANCGTWMDKMGSSDRAGNRGKPATPRDGSAVEIVGLSKSAIRWLDEMFQAGHYPYCMVERSLSADTSGIGKTIKMSFTEWGNLIQANFEKHFFVTTEPEPGESKYIHKRGIYKDCVNASHPWTDFQLRPNFPIAMSVAPELFTPKNAWVALENAEKYLLGPLGMKTLDPDDWAYDGFYDNSDDSTNQKRAKGWNYHQGPEWLWPTGYFLRAKLIFSSKIGKQEFLKTIDFIKRVMSSHFSEIQTGKWRGLPELTNKNGAHCKDSCVVQAWSHATLLEVLYEMDSMCSNEEVPEIS